MAHFAKLGFKSYSSINFDNKDMQKLMVLKTKQ